MILLVILTGCRDSPPSPHSLVNPAHLEVLFQRMKIQGQEMGAIWIYCEAPDYELTTDEDEGFTCVDDVSRALVFYSRHFSLNGRQETLDKIELLTEFILHMQSDDGLFNNFMFPDRSINTEHQNSQARPDWWSWRAFWALSEVILLENEKIAPLQVRCRDAIERLLPHVLRFCSDEEGSTEVDGLMLPTCFTQTGADQAAVILLALANTYATDPSEELRSFIVKLGNLLQQMQFGSEDEFPHGTFLSWKNFWHAWGNSQAHALLRVGHLINDQGLIESGLKEVRQFYPFCIEQGFLNEFQVMREETGYVPKNLRRYPQIAYGFRPMIFASLEAYAITGDPFFAETAGHLVTWFFGNNPAKMQMYDPISGRTYDGIGSPEDVNRNSGAESTIEGLLILQAVESNSISRQVLNNYMNRNE